MANKNVVVGAGVVAGFVAAWYLFWPAAQPVEVVVAPEPAPVAVEELATPTPEAVPAPVAETPAPAAVEPAPAPVPAVP